MPSLNFTTGEDPLSLERIRSVLVRLEDTIIFSLIERAQFAHNPRIYQKGDFEELSELGFHGSWLDWFLKETESFHGTFIASSPWYKEADTRFYSGTAKARRYTRYELTDILSCLFG